MQCTSQRHPWGRAAAAAASSRPHIRALRHGASCCPSGSMRKTRAVSLQATAARDAESVARQLYEDVWSTGAVEQLDSIMAEHHIQVDAIWQPSNTGGGRERMKRGITMFRKAYPDLRFTVQQASVADDGRHAFVKWHAAGTHLGQAGDRAPTGEGVAFSGIALLFFDGNGRICKSEVFRQAPLGEMQMFLGRAVQAAEAATTTHSAAVQ